MRRIICVLLTLCSIIVLCACSGNGQKAQSLQTPLDSILDHPSQDILISRLGEPDEEGEEALGDGLGLKTFHVLGYHGIDGFDYDGGNGWKGPLFIMYDNNTQEDSQFYAALWEAKYIPEERFEKTIETARKVLDGRFGKHLSEEKNEVESSVVWKVDANNSIFLYSYYNEHGEVSILLGPNELIKAESGI